MELGYLLPVLGCAAMMGVMMWMMRGSHTGRGEAAQPDQPNPETAEEIARLRTEIAALRAEQAAATRPDRSADVDHGIA